MPSLVVWLGSPGRLLGETHRNASDDARGETTYLVLGLVAESLLARRIFAGSLAGS
jgi:hypothetical protein